MEVRIRVGEKTGRIVAADEAELEQKLQQARTRHPELEVLSDASSPVQMDPPGPSVSESLMRGLGQGVTMDWGDEMAAAVSAGVNQLLLSEEEKGSLERSGVDYGYGGALDRQRDRLREAQQANPGSFLAGELTGGFGVPGIGAVKGARKIAQAVDNLKPMGALAVTGGAAGAITGAGVSEEETLSGIASDAAVGGLVGGITAPIVGMGVQRGGEALGALAMGLTRRFAADPETAALMRVRQAMEYDSIQTPEQARAELESLGPQGALADVSPNLREEAVLSGKQPGAGRDTGESFVRSRQLGSAERVSEAATEGLTASRFGTWGDDYYGFMDDLQRGRKDQARPLYEEAYEMDISPTPEMVRISKTDAFQQAAKRAMGNMRNKLDTFGPPRPPATDDGRLSTQFMDQILRELRDEANRAFRSGSNEYGADVNNIYKALRGEVLAQNPKLAQARGVWAGARQLEEAAETGRNLLRGNQQYAQDVERLMGDMSDGEKDAFTIGVIRGIMDKLENVAETGDVGRRLFQSRRVQNVLREAFQDDTAFQKFYEAVKRESQFQLLANRVTGGSPTAQLLFGADQARALEEVPADAGTFLARVWRSFVNDTVEESKLQPEDYEKIAEILFDPDISDETLTRIFTTAFSNRTAPDMLGAGAAAGTVGALEASGFAAELNQ